MSTAFALVNESTLVTDAQAAAMAQAIGYQLRAHVAPAWERMPPSFTFYPKGHAPPAGAVLFHLVDVLPEAPDALGYHDEQDDRPYARIGCKPVFDGGGTALTGPLSVSAVVSHEACEAFGDLDVNGWRDMPDGRQTAEELADAVQGDSYPVGKVSVSNFLLPAWFDRQATRGPFDHMRQCSAPFTMSAGGYMIVRDAGNASQVFGDRPAHRAGSVRHMRRGVQ
jgi:hypothetical protein